METQKETVLIENTSGQGAAAIAPEEIKGWSWGAFLLTWIWGIFNGTFIALLMFVPFVNIAIWFILGARGREWAWRNKRWASIEEFKRIQRKWALAGIIVVSVSLVITIAASTTLVFLGLNAAREKANDAKRIGDISVIQEAVEYYIEDNGTYPPDITNATLGSYFEDGSVPVEPTTGVAYGYAVNRNPAHYHIYTKLENANAYFLEQDSDLDSSKWSPRAGVNAQETCTGSSDCTGLILDLGR